MHETELKNKLRDDMKKAGCFVIRFEDKFTSGIPDLWAARNQRELWCEVKVDDHLFEPRRWKAFKLQQVVLCSQMEDRRGQPVWFLCYSPRTKSMTMLGATTLLHLCQEKLPIPANLEQPGNGLKQLLSLLEI